MRKSALFMFALAAGLLAATLIGSAPAAAGTVRIQDDAQILSASDQQNLTNLGQQAPFNVAIWTTSAYATKADLTTAVQNAVGNDEVVLAVDPVHRFTHISARQNTGLTRAELDQAESAANAQFGNKQWGAGFSAALNSLISVAPAAPANSTGNPTSPISTPGGGLNLGGCGIGLCLIPILLIAVIAFFFFRNRGANRGMTGGPVYPGQQYPNQGYGPGPYPPQGGYYPQQGSGIGGNIVSGGLGALAGGAIGYELGRQSGDRGIDQSGGIQGSAPDFGSSGGGIVDSSPGSGGPDFGAGSGSFGGGDFGGGGGSDFGGGGSDFGGGGGDSGGGTVL